MEKIKSVEVPISYENGEKWLVLKNFGDTGKLRAVAISKARQVHEGDSHHCNEISAKGSIRYHPKKWKINL